MILAVIFLHIAAWVGSQPAYGMQDNASGLVLSAATGKTQIALGEPVYLSTRLRNTGRDTVEVFPELSVESGSLVVRIVDGDGRLYHYRPLLVDDISAPLIPLPSGGALAQVTPIFFGTGGWTFSRPGSYEVTVVYRSPAREQIEVTSDPVRLTVTTASAAGVFLMQAGEATPEVGKFLTWQGGDHLEKGITHLQKLIEQFPEAVVTDYARLALGRNLSRGFRDYSKMQLRAADYPSALRYLNAIDSTRLPVYLQLQHQLAEASCYVALGQTQQANIRLSQAEALVREHPEFYSFYEATLQLITGPGPQQSR